METQDREVAESVLATAKEMVHCGLVEGTAGNVSGRLSGNRAVLTPSSVEYETMTVDDLVVMTLDGRILHGERPPTSEKALHLHTLSQHSDIGAVVHCHAMYATMFAVAHQPIPCIIEEFDVYVGGDVPVANYMLTGSDDLAVEASRHLENRGAVLMANHGLLTVGKNPADALKVARLVERTAQIAWGAKLLGPIVPLPDETLKRFAPVYKMIGRLR